MKRGKKESRIKGNSFGASGFTLGILSILSLGWIGIVLSVTGFVFCMIQQKNKPTKLGKTGIIINIVGLVLSAILVYLVVYHPEIMNNLLSSYQ